MKKGVFDKSNTCTRWTRPLHKINQTPALRKKLFAFYKKGGLDESSPYT